MYRKREIIALKTSVMKEVQSNTRALWKDLLFDIINIVKNSFQAASSRKLKPSMLNYYEMKDENQQDCLVMPRSRVKVHSLQSLIGYYRRKILLPDLNYILPLEKVFRYRLSEKKKPRALRRAKYLQHITINHRQ